MDTRLALLILKQELLNIRSILLVLLLALFFASLSLIIINFQSFSSFIFNDYPLFAKLNIMWLLFIGSFSTTSTLDITLVALMGILFGINMTLLINKFQALKRRGNVRIMFGTGVVSLVAAGCASCGLSFASLIGVTAALSLLPFGGIELYILAILILLASLFFNLKQLIKVCKIN